MIDLSNNYLVTLTVFGYIMLARFIVYLLDRGEFSMDDYMEFYVELVAETEKALLLEFGDQELWVPKSLLHDESDELGEDHLYEGKIYLAEWWAIEKGLV